MEKGESISGFVHNLSPVKNGPTKKYFDFNLQTGQNTVVRAICFSPGKRKCLEEAAEKSSPVKMRKFVHDKKEGSTDILMSDNVVIDKLECKDLVFAKQDLVPDNLNLSKLAMVSPNQLVTLKAKLIGLQQPQNVNFEGRNLKKANVVLIDPHGSMNIVLWEDDVTKVKEGETYQFKNLRLKKNKFTQELYVNPAKNDSEIIKCDGFEGVLAVPEHVPEEFTSSVVVGDVIGISDMQMDLCCVKCNKRIKQSEKIVTCDNVKCKLMQKLERCKKQWYLKALVSYVDGTVNLVFRHDAILKVMKLQASTGATSTLTQEVVSNAFLSLSDVKITYEKKTMVVTDIADWLF